jgi:hypothetical protein
MEIYRFAFIILLSSLLVSCGEKKQETGNADKAAEKKTPAFTLPEVPAPKLSLYFQHPYIQILNTAC